MAVAVNKYWTTGQKKKMQGMLNQYGFRDDNGNALAEDGVMGPKSLQALKKMTTISSSLFTRITG